MAMLAEKRKRVKYCLNPNGNLWNNDDNKFGQKLLEKMGWKKGQGLGVNNQGITERIKLPYKFDSAGLGFKEKDELLKQQSDFQNLLSQLNDSEIKVTSNDHSVSSLEEKSKKLKSRVHYQKFTRGKDISRYSSKDLSSILGPVVPVNPFTSDTSNIKEENNVNLINKGSMNDYLKKKHIETSNDDKIQHQSDELSEFVEVNGFSESVKSLDSNSENYLNSKKQKNKYNKSKEFFCMETEDNIEMSNGVCETDVTLENENETNKADIFIESDKIFNCENVIDYSPVSKKRKKKSKKSKLDMDEEKEKHLSFDNKIQDRLKTRDCEKCDSSFNFKKGSYNYVKIEENECSEISDEIVCHKRKKCKSKRNGKYEQRAENQVNENVQQDVNNCFSVVKKDKRLFYEDDTNLESYNNSYNRKKRKLNCLKKEHFDVQNQKKCEVEYIDNRELKCIECDVNKLFENTIESSSKKSKKKKKVRFQDGNGTDVENQSNYENVDSLILNKMELNKSSSKKLKVKKREKLQNDYCPVSEKNELINCSNEGDENILFEKESCENINKDCTGKLSIKSHTDKSKRRKTVLFQDIIDSESQVIEKQENEIDLKQKKKKFDASNNNESTDCDNETYLESSTSEKHLSVGSEENFIRNTISLEDQLQKHKETEIREIVSNENPYECFNCNEVFERKRIMKEFKKKAVPEFDAFVGSNWESLEGYGTVKNK